MGILLTATGAAAEGATGIAAIIPLIAWFVIIIGFMYFFMIRPQKKEQKKHPCRCPACGSKHLYYEHGSYEEGYGDFVECTDCGET